MKFIKILAELTDQIGNPRRDSETLYKEVLVPIEKIECIIETNYAEYTLKFEEGFLERNGLNCISVETSLGEFFRSPDKF